MRIVLMMLTFGVAAVRGQDLEAALPECTEWLKTAGREPAPYVVSKFADHDLVLLGEVHEIADNCRFVASLVGPLHRAGVRTLGTEFVRSAFNGKLAAILAAKDYDADGVVEIFRQGPWPTWGYREYMDIVKAAWELNRSLPEGAKPFRVVGIDGDWKQIEVMDAASPKDRMDILLDRERHLTETVEREVFGKKEKALLHIGFAHSVRHGARLAAELAKEHDERMFQILLHHEISADGRGLTAFIERMAAGAGIATAGFDVEGTPLARLRDPDSMAFKMLGPRSGFEDLAQGWILLQPVKSLSRVSWHHGFITGKNFPDARAVAEGLGWIVKDSALTPEALDAALSARLTRR